MPHSLRVASIAFATLLPMALFGQAVQAPPSSDNSAPHVERANVDFETVLRGMQALATPAKPPKGGVKGESIDAYGNLSGAGGIVKVDGSGGAGVSDTAYAGTPSITSRLGATTQSAQWSIFNSNGLPLIWSEGTGATKMAIPSTFSSTYGSSTAALTFWHSTNTNYPILNVYGGTTGTNMLVQIANSESSSYVATFGLYKDGIVRSFLSASTASPSYLLGTLALGKATVGTGYTLDVSGTLHADTITSTNGINAVYQDLAEWVPFHEKVDTGMVVVVDPDATNEVSPSSHAYQTSVAGVVSDKPGVLLGKASDDKAKIATTGRVKVKVDASAGAIRPGDLLVTSDRPGFAMKSQPVSIGGIEMHRPGTLVGKALEPLADGQGEILVLLSLQ
jgi:hypothetical protein